MCAGKFYGKHRGTVVGTADPLELGRVQVRVPAVSGDQDVWAEACVPFAGPGMGLYAIPPVGTGVWVEYEQGDQDYPIWTGCIRTEPLGGLPGAQGGIVLGTASGARVVVTDDGVTIDNGKGASIELVGITVNVNNGALTVA